MCLHNETEGYPNSTLNNYSRQHFEKLDKNKLRNLDILEFLVKILYFKLFISSILFRF